MPREYVRNSDGTYEVAVGWNPNAEDVQVGIFNPEGKSLVWLLYGYDEDALIRLGDEIRNRLELPTRGSKDESANIARDVLNSLDTVSVYESLWATLKQRSMCNSLIRKLRHARDSAFGRDE